MDPKKIEKKIEPDAEALSITSENMMKFADMIAHMIIYKLKK